MKTTTINTRCRRASRRSPLRTPRLAHSQPRRAGARDGDSRQSGSEPVQGCHDDAVFPQNDRLSQTGRLGPRVLHVDADPVAASVLSGLLTPEAHVINAPTLAEARRLMASEVFSLLVVDPALPDGDIKSLLPLLSGTPVLIYSAHQPEWRGVQAEFLPKPWTTARQLWVAISTKLGISSGFCAGA